ncbi:LysR family transcriptional regulator [Mesorhizobium sp. NZP2077]|uniref:LysR family transcriptional regulator n=1 Tax=Mesorhizobium sp. NZP2077 TaxID=2483404 RepID=UPI001552D132|nr:LysR family transcriptional regulator [Mesorhizobium sp. NZP2077]QKC86895.1 LysR family transcriptional regulator [Mesorhizobium sp. NZP2077]QKD20596.1 LysR family transcriptional regulator [Mesorhizobium sp. NZP2077]
MRSKTLYQNIQRLLPTFEAAARWGNFTLAGEEVGLSQSSVSKQNSQLEGRLGQPLFAKAHKKIALTPAGDRLLRAYSVAASQIIDALEDLIQERSRQQIVLSTSSANATFMLLPRVAEVTHLKRVMINGYRVPQKYSFEDGSLAGLSRLSRPLYGPGWAPARTASTVGDDLCRIPS